MILSIGLLSIVNYTSSKIKRQILLLIKSFVPFIRKTQVLIKILLLFYCKKGVSCIPNLDYRLFRLYLAS